VPIAASWASTSYQHISAPSPPKRPGITTSKTYTDGAPPPAPGTVINGSNGLGGVARLPPGGAWEIVGTSDVREGEEEVEVVKVGKEAVREDVEDILRGG